MFGLGQDLVKGGKTVTAMALRAACSGIGKYKLTHIHTHTNTRICKQGAIFKSKNLRLYFEAPLKRL